MRNMNAGLFTKIVDFFRKIKENIILHLGKILNVIKDVAKCCTKLVTWCKIHLQQNTANDTTN